MTIEEKFKGMLMERGILYDTDNVMAFVKKSDLTKSMVNRWGDQLDDYPPAMVSVLWLAVKAATLKWIEENKPKAFYKDLFVI